MEIRQLRHFIAAAEAGNMRKAGESIHISQPALSMSIRNLEEDLGVTLLNKNRQGVQLTYAGEQFLKSAHSLLRQIDDIHATLKGTGDSPTGNVKLGIPYGPNNALAALLYQQMLEKYPGINLRIEEGITTGIERQFEENMIDLMINYDVMEKSHQKCEPLYVEQLYLISKYDPDLDGIEEIDSSELANYPIASSSGTHSMRRAMEKYAFDNGVFFNFVGDFASPHSSLRIVEAGIANKISPWDEIYDDVGINRFSARKLVNPPLERTVCLISSLSNRNSLATIAVIDAIKSAVIQARSEDRLRGKTFFI